MDIVAICNMALGNAGVSRFIMDINEKSNEAIICNKYLDSVRDICLSDFPWNFAMRYHLLQLQAAPPVTQFLNRYAYPNDCVVARFLSPQNTATTPPPGYNYAPGIIEMLCDKIPFEVVEDEANGGLAIETDLQNAVLAYTARITTVALWSAKFIDAFTWLLTTKIAPALSSDGASYVKAAGDAYAMAILSAGASNLNESGQSGPRESEFLTARY